MIAHYDVVIIGAGAAGLMAAGSVLNKSILVLERNEKAGKKLYITGKGRCNVTNDCTPDEFLTHIVTNPRFLYSAINGFTPQDTVHLLNSCKVPTKTERGNRVFPVSDKASDVIKALYVRACDNGARFVFDSRVTCVKSSENGFTVITETGDYKCNYVIVATGGKSYPLTGSTGDGYEIAKDFGHALTDTRPSLTSFTLKENVFELSGLTLKNVTVKVTANGKEYSEFGEMLYTHNGVSGPTILRLSAYVNSAKMPVKMSVDLKPALDENTLDKRIVSDFAQFGNKQLKNSLDLLLPKSLIMPVIAQSGLNPEKKVNIISKEERLTLVSTLKNLTYTVAALGGFDNAVVTAGGVDVKYVNPKTMESKLVKNLYFAGEILDVDALTGGFNIQIALSTAFAAAKAI